MSNIGWVCLTIIIIVIIVIGGLLFEDYLQYKENKDR